MPKSLPPPQLAATPLFTPSDTKPSRAAAVHTDNPVVNFIENCASLHPFATYTHKKQDHRNLAIQKPLSERSWSQWSTGKVAAAIGITLAKVIFIVPVILIALVKVLVVRNIYAFRVGTLPKEPTVSALPREATVSTSTEGASEIKAAPNTLDEIDLTATGAAAAPALFETTLPQAMRAAIHQTVLEGSRQNRSRDSTTPNLALIDLGDGQTANLDTVVGYHQLSLGIPDSTSSLYLGTRHLFDKIKVAPSRKPKISNQEFANLRTSSLTTSYLSSMAPLKCIEENTRGGKLTNAPAPHMIVSLNKPTIEGATDHQIPESYTGIEHEAFFINEGTEAEYIHSLTNKRLTQIFKKMDEQIINGESVFLHCNNGEHRSATVLVLYLASRGQCSFEDAWHCVMNFRPIIKPFNDNHETLMTIAYKMFKTKLPEVATS